MEEWKKLVANLKVALVHDSLCEFGGAERVLMSLMELFPQAPVYTAMYYPQSLGVMREFLSKREVKTTYLQKIPGHYRLRSPLRLLAASAFSHLDLSAYDLVITSTSAYHAKAVHTRPDAIHLCYCHTPARSLYGYATGSNWQAHPGKRFLGELVNHYLRLVDYQTAQNPNVIIANSKVTQKRVSKFWRRESKVIYPPVALVDKIKEQAVKKMARGDFYLYINRLYYAKHPELALEACLQLNLPLKIVGTGALLPQLEARLANDKGRKLVELKQNVNDEQLLAYYRGAKALLYPVEDEDFGIVPIEAMACGTPVIAHASGGPQETITPQTGVFFKDLTTAALVTAIKSFQKRKFKTAQIKKQAQQFSAANFKYLLKKQIQDILKTKKT